MATKLIRNIETHRVYEVENDVAKRALANELNGRPTFEEVSAEDVDRPIEPSHDRPRTQSEEEATLERRAAKASRAELEALEAASKREPNEETSTPQREAHGREAVSKRSSSKSSSKSDSK